MKKFFSLFAAVLFAGSMMAETVTLTMEKFAATSFTDQTSGITVATAKNDGSNDPTYNDTGKDLRIYAKGSITISAEKNITGISFTISTQGKKRLAPLTASAGTATVAGDPDFTAKWAGSAQSVTLTVGDKAEYGTEGNSKAGQLDFTAIVVTLEGEGSGEGGDQPGEGGGDQPGEGGGDQPGEGGEGDGSVVTFTKADFAGQGTANSGSEVSATKGGVTFSYSKGYCADESLRCYAHGALSVTASAKIAKINFTTTGGKDGGLQAEVEVNATSYSIADLASQARLTEIKVTLGEGGGSEGGDQPGEGGEIVDPTNCAEAREAALSVSANNELYNDGKEYTIEGYVTEIAYAWKEGSMSFWMADTKDGGKVLEAYKCAIENEADAVREGDKVAVTGKLTKFNTTPEFAEGCTVEIIEKGEGGEGGGGDEPGEMIATGTWDFVSNDYAVYDDNTVDFNFYTVEGWYFDDEGNLYGEGAGTVLYVNVPYSDLNDLTGTYSIAETTIDAEYSGAWTFASDDDEEGTTIEFASGTMVVKFNSDHNAYNITYSFVDADAKKYEGTIENVPLCSDEDGEGGEGGEGVLDIDFTKGQGAWTIQNMGLPEGLTYVWQQDPKYGMKASAFANKTAYAAESWLISPAFSLSEASTATLAISHAVNKGNPADFLSVQIKVGEGDWQELTLKGWPAGDSWDFVDATADLSYFAGETDLFIAFVYTSTAETAPIWEIKTVKVTTDAQTAVENTTVGGAAVKSIENAMLIIERNGVRYNVMGQVVR